MTNKKLTKNINGILLLNKPLNLTSNAALQRIKRLFGAKKAGHTGSLDPLATGMLPICFGEATKISQFLLDSDKYYRVTVKLGIRTTTGDAEGEIIATQSVDVPQTRLETVLQKFTGAIEQIPPMYSAVKHQGQPLYKLARRGIEVERKPRVVQIHTLQLKEFSADTFIIDVHCSKGTYIRTLADDIGQVLCCGAYVIGLHRLAVAPYEQTKMYAMDALEEICAQQGVAALQNYLLPLDTSLQAFPIVKLSPTTVFYIRTGQPVIVPHLPTEGFVRLYSGEQFMGVGEILDDGRVAPRRLFNLA